MKSRDQIFLFVLIALVGTGVVVTAWTMPPSRFDPVGTKNIMGVIGILVALFAAICAFLTFNQMRQAGQVESQNPPGMFMTKTVFVVGPALMSVLIVNRLVSTNIVLASVFILVGVLVIWASPGLRFEGKTLGGLVLSALVMTVGVTQLFQQVLGLPLP
ncbi:MAG: hypothetical protein GKR97_19805 [Rhizobiaceae bacterium]|nr:hypothetical protein [Rhizobiaceae bacterium]